MKFSKTLIVIVCAMLAMVALGPSKGFSAGPCMECQDLKGMNFGPGVKITSAEVLPKMEGTGVFGPYSLDVEQCDVRGTIWPAQGFNVKLPTGTGWNNRLYVIGNGIAAGQISEEFMIPGLAQGFATAGTDTGHQGEMVDWSFGNNPPDNSNPHFQEKLIDYCDESIHETTTLAKKIIETYYGNAPAYSYYVGCSTGGRQGLIEAQRYPTDFDGILFGAPVHHLAEIMIRGIWEGQQMIGPGAINLAKLPLLAKAVMDKCDSIDGLADGLIDDPLRCTFDARTDLPACKGDVDGPDCFTTAQRNAIYAIYNGPSNSTGDLLTFGQAFGSEAIAASMFGPPGLPPGSGWIQWIVSPNPKMPALSPIIGIGFAQHIGIDPPPGPEWNFMTFSFDTDGANIMTNFAPLCNATDPDLSDFKKLGGKIIHYDGWADQATGPYQSVNYYESVLDVMGEKATQEFYKLYMIPGMFHCGGGLGCFDEGKLFTALMDWVEKGIEPTSYTGSGVNPSGDPRTRPMCPYPQVARYLGEGSIEAAENFTCVELIPAKVRIDADPLDLGTSGTFEAIITLPSGFYPGYGLWKNLAVVCEGASAKNVKKFELRGRLFRKKGNTFTAEFNKEDLVNITPGEDVTFTVTAIFEHKSRKPTRSKRVAFEGSDEVVVIGE